MFESLVHIFKEEEFKGYFKGFLLDSKRLHEWMEGFELYMLAEYIPNVFWKKMRERYISLYAADGIIQHLSGRKEDIPVLYAEDLLILNTLFSDRYLKHSFRKANKARPKEEYYLNFGAFFYRLSYVKHGVDVYKLMNVYYRPIVKELRELTSYLT